MTPPDRPDPLDRLRLENPVDTDRLPSASLARIKARVQEETMVGMEAPTRRARTSRWGAFGLAAGAVAIAALALVAVLAPGVLTPGVGPAPSGGPGGGLASCVETYSLEALARRSFAFDGTVSSVSGERVVFTVNQRFRGDLPDPVTLTATGMTGTAITSAGGPTLVVGQRYLVAGEDQFAWACGFTQPYDAGVAAQWAQATR